MNIQRFAGKHRTGIVMIAFIVGLIKQMQRKHVHVSRHKIKGGNERIRAVRAPFEWREETKLKKKQNGKYVGNNFLNMFWCNFEQKRR